MLKARIIVIIVERLAGDLICNWLLCSKKCRSVLNNASYWK